MGLMKIRGVLLLLIYNERIVIKKWRIFSEALREHNTYYIINWINIVINERMIILNILETMV